MYKFSPHAIAPFVSCGISLPLAIFIFLKNRTQKLNLTLSAFAFFTSIWQFATGMMFMAKTDALGLFWDRCVYLAVAMMFPTAYHFAVLLAEAKNQKNWIRLGYLIAFIYLIVSRTDYFVSDFYKYKWGGHAIARIFHHPFVLISTFYYLKGIYLVFKKYQETTLSIKRQQYKYYFIAFFIYTLGTIAYLPAYKIGIYPFAYWFATIYIVIVSYSIIRYRLLEIDTVIHRTFLWLITSAAVFLPIFITTLFMRNLIYNMNRLNLSLFLTVLFFIIIYYYKKTQPKIDHIFRRRKYDYYKTLEEVAQKVGSEIEMNDVVSRLFRELKEVLYIRNSIILVQQAGEEQDYLETGSIGYESLAGDKTGGGVKVAYSSKLVQWLLKHKKSLEREQIEIDPLYLPIKDEVQAFFKEKSLEVVVPMIMKDKVNALVGIGKKENLSNYTIKDIELLENMGNQVGVTIDNALHHGDILEKERLAEDLRLGWQIQQNLLPKITPTIEGLKLGGLMIPAQEIGGDYYDFIQGPGGNLGIVIGDVSGKGVAAGLIMATAKATLKGLSRQALGPKEILSQTNQLLFEYTNAQKFITLLYFQYQEKEKVLKYSSAGHEYILVYRAKENTVEVITSGGFMLGMLPDINTYLEERAITLNPQDKILLYTDGVTDAENSSGERFGLPRLKETFQKHGSKPANELLQAIKEETYGFIGSHPQYDDITLVVMER